MRAIILYDGVCKFCNAIVGFIIPRDPDAYFSFVPIQSELARKLLIERGLSPELSLQPESLILIDDEGVHQRSTAALRIAGRLHGAWSWLRIFKGIPEGFRDGVYNWIARHRYRWRGQFENCPLPPPEWRQRFLD